MTTEHDPYQSRIWVARSAGGNTAMAAGGAFAETPSGLPAGVTLQAIDGETMLTPTTMSLNYYSRGHIGSQDVFSFATNTATNGTSWDSPNFFPLACFYGLEGGTSGDCTGFQGLNLNVSDATFGSATQAPIDAAGIWVLNGASNVSGGGPTEPPWQSAVCCGFIEDEGDPAIVLSLLDATHTNNRFFKTNFTWNQLANGDFGGTPLPTYLNATYPTLTGGVSRYIDITSVDVYWFAGSPTTTWQSNGGQIYQNGGKGWTGGALTSDQMARGSNYGNSIDIQRAWNPARGSLPQWLYIENGNGNLSDPGNRAITSNELHWAIWSVIIHGAAGISYFFEWEFFTGAVATQATADNLLVTQLAPVIRSPFALNYFSVSPLGYQFPVTAISNTMFNTGIDACAHWYQGGNITNHGLALVNGFYIFATTRASQATTSISATFTVASGTLATVVGESRTINIVAGQFTDTFANAWTVHIYQIS